MPWHQMVTGNSRVEFRPVLKRLRTNAELLVAASEELSNEIVQLIETHVHAIPSPRITLDPPFPVNASYSSRASGTVPFSDSCMGFAPRFLQGCLPGLVGRDLCRSPGVTHESSVSCRQQTPWFDGRMSNAFAP
jgi:hypothetical protein